jgi:hypothetical protein
MTMKLFLHQTGLIKIIAWICIFVIINLSLVNACMQLINVVPDNIVDWIGGRISTNSLGKSASDEVGGAAKSALAGGGWVPKKPKPPSSVGGGVDNPAGGGGLPLVTDGTAGAVAGGGKSSGLPA